MRSRWLGLGVVTIGVLMIALVQWVAPVAGPPLYDGVIVVEPYRWLVPPPGAKGDPTSASATAQIDHGKSPLVAIATAEEPPQAQIFATDGSLVLPPGTTSIKISITPILPQTLPTDGHIAGNVYRFSVTNQVGVPLTAPERAKVSVVMRGPDGTVDAAIERYSDQGWQPLKTTGEGFGATFLAVVTEFGDFALVAPGPGGPYPTTSPASGASEGVSSTGGSDAPSTSAAVGSLGPTAPASDQPAPIGPQADDRTTSVLIAGLIVVVLTAAGAAFLVRRRRRRSRYQGAHRRRQ